MHGFWKKLIYIIDVDASLQLCAAVRDVDSFKLNFMVEKLGTNNAKTIDEAIKDVKKFESLVKVNSA